MKKAKHKAKLAAAVASARKDAIAEACRYLKHDMGAPAVGDAVWSALVEKPVVTIDRERLASTETPNVWRLD